MTFVSSGPSPNLARPRRRDNLPSDREGRTPLSNRYLKQFEGTEHEKTTVKLLGIRGFYEDLGNPHKNDLGIYDDLIVRRDHADTK